MRRRRQPRRRRNVLRRRHDQGSASNTVDKLIQANIAAAGYGSSIDLSDTVPVEPYKTTLQIPGKIEAEDYIKGGNGPRFLTRTFPTNPACTARTTQAPGTAGGATVYGWVTEGDWLRYTVKFRAPKMTVSARVASAATMQFSLPAGRKGDPTLNFNVPQYRRLENIQVTDTLDSISEGKSMF